MRSAKTFAVAVLNASSTFPATAETQTAQPEPWRDWRNVPQLQSGRTVRIETMQPKRKLKGRFVSSDDSGITVEFANSKSETIAKTDVRKVRAERKSMKDTPLIGTAAGGIVFAVLMAKTDDIVASGKAMFIGIGAGIGALGGSGVGALGRHKLIYEAPKAVNGLGCCSIGSW